MKTPQEIENKIFELTKTHVKYIDENVDEISKDISLIERNRGYGECLKCLLEFLDE